MSSIDPQKTYDYDTAFDIKPTEVVYNVDLDMNRKKILNIAPDRTRNNSAANVKMVKDLETKLSPHTKNNVYRKIFKEFYDFSNAGIYKIVDRGQPSGIVINGLLPNIYFTNMYIANIWEGGLRIQNNPVSLTLFGKKNFTLCVVMRGRAKVQVTGHRSGHRLQTAGHRSQAIGHRPQVTQKKQKDTRENCSGLTFYYTKIK